MPDDLDLAPRVLTPLDPAALAGVDGTEGPRWVLVAEHGFTVTADGTESWSRDGTGTGAPGTSAEDAPRVQVAAWLRRLWYRLRRS